MPTERFDAVVIGAGQGGTPLSKAMAGNGWTTALIESRYLGGVCANEGCTPTKTMVASAKVAAMARRAAEFGIQCGPVTTDMRAVIARKEHKVQNGRQAVEQAVAEQQDLEVIYGEGSFAEEQPGDEQYAIHVALKEGGTRVLQTGRVFVDTGLRPHVPEIEGLADVPSLDSRTIMELAVVPEHLLILGGGYIALEFAQMFRRFGSAVTVMERGAQVLEHEDEDIAACMKDVLELESIRILLNTEARKISGAEGALTVEATVENGSTERVTGTHLLVATGRVPNTEALHVQRVGVELDEQGYVRHNDRLETTAKNIWVIGDVKGGPAFSHISYDDFRVLRQNLLEGGSRSIHGRPVPYAIFTDPELGRIGMTEQQAKKAGVRFEVATMPMTTIARASEMSETRGMIKAIVERGTGRLLGAAALGVQGGEIAAELQLAMQGGLTAHDLREAIFTHPVLAEGFHPLFRALDKKI